jgi:hypothetical protein
MTVVENKFGSYLPTSPFQNKTLFFSLFVAVYYLVYGDASTATKAKPTALTLSQINHIIKCGDKIGSSTAPRQVIDAASLRTTHISSRTAIFKYLAGVK